MPLCKRRPTASVPSNVVTGSWTIAPFALDAAERLVSELGLNEVTASVLVRRGYGDPEDASRFLAAELPGHDPLLLGDMAVAVERIREAVAKGQKICVHGDYDVDGICATVLAILVLRELGADVGFEAEATWVSGDLAVIRAAIPD